MPLSRMNAISRLRAPTRHAPLSRSDWPTSELLATYLQHWPLLAMSGVFWLGTLLIVTSIPPAAINWKWLPNAYLPFQLVTFGGLFFLCSFSLLHTRRGFLLAACIQTLLFLKLQQVDLTAQLVLSLMGMFVIIEVLIISGNILFSHANFSQKPHRHHRNRHP